MVLFPKNTYWLLPTPIRNLLNRLVEARSSWELHLRKDQDGCYYFNYPPIAWNESLCGGTELCIDALALKLTGRTPATGDKLIVLASDEPIPNPATILEWREDDGFGGNYYHCTTTGKEAYLCGMSQVLFSYVPSRLYISLSLPNNNGLQRTQLQLHTSDAAG